MLAFSCAIFAGEELDGIRAAGYGLIPPEKPMSNEKLWVESLQPRLQSSLITAADGEWRVEVCTGEKLSYANEILLYQGDGTRKDRSASYETDILVRDIRPNGDWIPRVVVECKLGSVTTHDALTYSTKAATHKHVHPYLRYGCLIGGFGAALPGRLIRHGAYFDFMMVWSSEKPTNGERKEFSELLIDEIKASRSLLALLTESRIRDRKRFRLLHRPLRLSGTEDRMNAKA